MDLVLQALVVTAKLRQVSLNLDVRALGADPRTRWIHSLARIDPSLLQLLRHARKGEWQYGKIPASDKIRELGPKICQSMGVDSDLGMPDKVGYQHYLRTNTERH